MAFQPSGFEPTPKPRLPSRRRRKRRPFDHLKAAPSLSPLEQNAWQRGYTDVSGWAKRKPVLVQIATTIAGCGFGLTLGSTWWERGLFGALVAAGVFLAGLVVLWLWHSVTAPVRQRDEARRYASALEAQVTAYKQWVRRRQIAEDFKDEALGLVHALPYQLEHIYDIATATDDWRTRLRTVGRQLEAHGGSDVCAEQIAMSLRALDETEGDGYPDDESRLRNNMLSAGQNVWTYVRSEEQPASPPPPGGVS
jgi:hypothetical protein